MPIKFKGNIKPQLTNILIAVIIYYFKESLISLLPHNVSQSYQYLGFRQSVIPFNCIINEPEFWKWAINLTTLLNILVCGKIHFISKRLIFKWTLEIQPISKAWNTHILCIYLYICIHIYMLLYVIYIYIWICYYIFWRFFSSCFRNVIPY